ncbi:MAG: deoxyribonuclease IV [Zhaonellaceae bacterium]|nr:deoxyribonuclease IV [Clostridia bacterium]
MYIGAHISISKGFSAAVEQAVSIGADTMQFFTRNPRGASAKQLNPKDVEAFKEKVNSYKFGPIVAHAPYTMNMAAAKDDLWELAIRVIGDDLTRLDELEVPYMAVHPGSHVGQGTEVGIQKVAKALNIIHKHNNNSQILLEAMAGSGTEVGKSFEELASIISLLDKPEKVGVCLDTCHLYGAGYDVKDNLEGVLQELDNKLGLDKVKAIHLNDSLQPLGSRKDRHANIGEGLIGKEALANIVNHPKLKHLPFLLETPGGIDNYAQEIAFIKSQVK